MPSLNRTCLIAMLLKSRFDDISWRFDLCSGMERDIIHSQENLDNIREWVRANLPFDILQEDKS